MFGVFLLLTLVMVDEGEILFPTSIKAWSTLASGMPGRDIEPVSESRIVASTVDKI